MSFEASENSKKTELNPEEESAETNAETSTDASEESSEESPEHDARWHGLVRFVKATDAEVRRHLPIVRKMLATYEYGSTLSYDEKLAAGLLGVALAIEKWDPGRNVKYAYWLAYQIDKAIRNESRQVRRQRRFETRSLDEKFDVLDESGWETAWRRESSSEKEDARRLVNESLATLDERSRYAVRRVCMEGASQQQVARELGCSQSWTSKLIRAALGKLRREYERRAGLAEGSAAL